MAGKLFTACSGPRRLSAGARYLRSMGSKPRDGPVRGAANERGRGPWRIQTLGRAVVMARNSGPLPAAAESIERYRRQEVIRSKGETGEGVADMRVSRRSTPKVVAANRAISGNCGGNGARRTMDDKGPARMLAMLSKWEPIHSRRTKHCCGAQSPLRGTRFTRRLRELARRMANFFKIRSRGEGGSDGERKHETSRNFGSRVGSNFGDKESWLASGPGTIRSAEGPCYALPPARRLRGGRSV